MSTLSELLNFYFVPKDMIHLGQKLVTPETTQKMERCKAELHKIQRQDEGHEHNIPSDSETIYQLFTTVIQSNPKQLPVLFNSRRKLRSLSYALGYAPAGKISILANVEWRQQAFSLLEAGWHRSLFMGLIDTLLQNWKHSGAADLRNFLAEHLSNPQEPRTTMIAAKKHLWVSEKGPLNLAYYMVKQKIPLKEGHHELGTAEYSKSYAYYNEVVRIYIYQLLLKQNWAEVLHSLIDFLREQKNLTFNKLILAPLILEVDKLRDPEMRGKYQKELSPLANELIGDPSKEHQWLPWNDATDEEKKELNEARQAIKNWVTHFFIEIFFHELASKSDPRRIKFWSKYIKYIDNFRIFGQEHHYQKLLGNPLIQSNLRRHWRYLGKDKVQNIFIMEIADYVLIEFGQTGGAFYAVKKGKHYCPRLDQDGVPIDEFRPVAVRDYVLWPRQGSEESPYPEGCLHHRGNWEERLGLWMEKYISFSPIR